MPHPQEHRRLFGSFLVIVALLGVSCTTDGDDAASERRPDADPATTTASPKTTTPRLEAPTTTALPTPAEAVLAAYLAYWDAVDEAFGPPEVDPASPGLRSHATGEVLAGIVERANEVKAENAFVRTPKGSGHETDVVSIEESTATVRDCIVDDAVLERVGSGEILDDAVSTREYTAMLVLEEGQWKVAALDETNTWAGVAGCAIE